MPLIADSIAAAQRIATRARMGWRAATRPIPQRVRLADERIRTAGDAYFGKDPAPVPGSDVANRGNFTWLPHGRLVPEVPYDDDGEWVDLEGGPWLALEPAPLPPARDLTPAEVRARAAEVVAQMEGA